MSSTSSTTYTWACDLCQKEAGTTVDNLKLPDTLTRITVLGPPDTSRIGSAMTDTKIKVDLCAECMQRPIAELLEILEPQK